MKPTWQTSDGSVQLWLGDARTVDEDSVKVKKARAAQD